jgi:small-conductance mechanosensitive channel
MGVIASKMLSKVLTRSIQRRGRLSPSSEATLSAFSYYTLLLIFTFFALSLSNIPLTTFTFIGGAVAIGVGFGSQNIIKNFISGIILMVEKPISPGDIIEVNNLIGTVFRIGARSTVVITPDNIDVIVPNSMFLENQVVNWTLRDPQIRRSIQVGVAYGSDPKHVLQILEQTAKAHPDVLSDIEPFALMTGFGDSSLDFELLYWVNMNTIKGGRIIDSQLRCQINEAFLQQGIRIPFPQRDVHMFNANA